MRASQAGAGRKSRRTSWDDAPVRHTLHRAFKDDEGLQGILFLGALTSEGITRATI